MGDEELTAEVLKEGRQLLTEADTGRAVLSLYVQRDENPFTALRKIRRYLSEMTDRDHRWLALPVVCIDRVLSTLSECEVRRSYRG